MKIEKLLSPAKINIRLDVIGKRKDGYHDLRMINIPISLFDEIECNIIEKGLVVECVNDKTVPNGEENIVYKITKEILAYTNKTAGLHIRIKKNIPSCAGMGGGSSNAATILMGLNKALKIGLSQEKLMKIGQKFGADIPFFIAQGPAIAEGIGEKITKIKKIPKLALVVVTPKIQVSTKWVFENYTQPVQKIEWISDLPTEFSTKKSLIKYLNNDLETFTVQKHPVIGDLKTTLVKMGALCSQMTGSGPTVFGIFQNLEDAVQNAKKLKLKLPEFHIAAVESIN